MHLVLKGRHLLEGANGGALHCDDLPLAPTRGTGGGSGAGLDAAAGAHTALFQPAYADILPVQRTAMSASPLLKPAQQLCKAWCDNALPAHVC